MEFEKLQMIIAEVLGKDSEQIYAKARLVEDLGIHTFFTGNLDCFVYYILEFPISRIAHRITKITSPKWGGGRRNRHFLQPHASEKHAPSAFADGERTDR